MSVHAASLENLAHLAVWALLSQDQPAARLATAGRRVRDVLDLLESLAKLRAKEPLRTGLLEVVREAKAAFQERNDLLHPRLIPAWGGQREVVARVKLPKSSAQGPTVVTEVIPLRKIRDLASGFQRIEAALLTLATQLGVQTEPMQ